MIFGLRQVRPAQVAVENLVGLHLPGLVPSDGAAVTVEKVELRVRYPARRRAPPVRVRGDDAWCVRVCGRVCAR